MSILIVGGAGYIGSQTAKRVAQAGLNARGVRQPRLRAQVGGQVGPVRRGRPRRRRADQARAGAIRGDRRRALRRLRVRGRVGDQPAQVLPQQRRWNAQPARRDDRRRRARHRVLVDMRHLRRAGARADRRAASPKTDQPVRRVEARDRAGPALVSSAPTPCGSRRCATSTPLAPIPTARSARTTLRKRTSSRSRSRRRGAAKASRSTAPTTRPPTERRSAITSTSRIWPTHTSRRWTSCGTAPPACSSTSARAAGTRCGR